ncbi:MAG: thioredoxin-disulfide reductase [Anaerolineae bacterium]|nr:thioredoxin-disulfide reductase [Anaerolineae bacterium]MDW8099233.1 thioredoxin-disulfide reductase [Anaerolineae bacterium]
MSTELENVIIIGSGPAGLTAGLYAARAELKPLLLTGNEIGGQISLTTDVENYPGFPEAITGPELIERMREQAEKFGCRIEHDYVTRVDFLRHPFIIETGNGKQYAAKAVIVATGATPRRLGVPGEQEFTGRGVSYCATCDGFFFRGKELVVVGGGDSALEEGLFLTRFATKVRIVHRRDQLRASQILQRRAFANEKIEFIWNSIVTAIHGDGSVRSVTLRNVKTGEESELKTDGVFIYIGHIPNTQLFVGQLEMDPDGYLIVDKRMRTNIPGVFAAGDVQDRYFRQVATAVGQGCAAAMEAEKFIAELEDRAYEGHKEAARSFEAR